LPIIVEVEHTRRDEYRLMRKGRAKEMGFQLLKEKRGFNFLRKREVKRSDTGEFEIGEGVT